MINILALEGWSKEGSELEFTKDDFDLKYLELYASELHNSVEEINKLMSSSKYVIETIITGEDNNYKLFAKIQYYGNESEHEHKKNSHRQEINI